MFSLSEIKKEMGKCETPMQFEYLFDIAKIKYNGEYSDRELLLKFSKLVNTLVTKDGFKYFDFEAFIKDKELNTESKNINEDESINEFKTLNSISTEDLENGLFYANRKRFNINSNIKSNDVSEAFWNDLSDLKDGDDVKMYVYGRYTNTNYSSTEFSERYEAQLNTLGIENFVDFVEEQDKIQADFDDEFGYEIEMLELSNFENGDKYLNLLFETLNEDADIKTLENMIDIVPINVFEKALINSENTDDNLVKLNQVFENNAGIKEKFGITDFNVFANNIKNDQEKVRDFKYNNGIFKIINNVFNDFNNKTFLSDLNDKNSNVVGTDLKQEINYLENPKIIKDIVVDDNRKETREILDRRLEQEEKDRIQLNELISQRLEEERNKLKNDNGYLFKTGKYFDKTYNKDGRHISTSNRYGAKLYAEDPNAFKEVALAYLQKNQNIINGNKKFKISINEKNSDGFNEVLVTNIIPNLLVDNDIDFEQLSFKPKSLLPKIKEQYDLLKNPKVEFDLEENDQEEDLKQEQNQNQEHDQENNQEHNQEKDLNQNHEQQDYNAVVGENIEDNQVDEEHEEQNHVQDNDLPDELPENLDEQNVDLEIDNGLSPLNDFSDENDFEIDNSLLPNDLQNNDSFDFVDNDIPDFLESDEFNQNNIVNSSDITQDELNRLCGNNVEEIKNDNNFKNVKNKLSI